MKFRIGTVALSLWLAVAANASEVLLSFVRGVWK